MDWPANPASGRCDADTRSRSYLRLKRISNLNISLIGMPKTIYAYSKGCSQVAEIRATHPARRTARRLALEVIVLRVLHRHVAVVAEHKDRDRQLVMRYGLEFLQVHHSTAVTD